MVVHGHNGLCDLTITGPTQIAEVVDGNTTARTIEPEELSLTRAPLNALLVPSASASAEAVRDILAGIPGPRRDHAVLNASAALVVAGVANDLTDGVTRAAEAIDSGRAKATLDRLVEVSAS
jgi:anthranilate phosphoribosyltransferase